MSKNKFNFKNKNNKRQMKMKKNKIRSEMTSLSKCKKGQINIK